MAPAVAVAVTDADRTMGTEWLDGSERFPLAPIGASCFRVGSRDWSPERLRFDTVIDGLAQRAVYSGSPYYRAFTD